MNANTLAPWLTRTHGATQPAAAPRKVRIVIEVDADDAPWLVRELHRVATDVPTTGQTSILAACSRARIEGGA